MKNLKYQEEKYQEITANLHTKGLLRSLPSKTKNIILDFRDNDYLDFSNNTKIIVAAKEFLDMWGIGGKASRLVTSPSIYTNLEEKIAKAKNKAKSLIFSSGYLTNSTILAALLNPKVLMALPLVFSDRLNHASIHSGCKLAGVKQIRYTNVDMQELEQYLDFYKTDKRPKFIISETVFSMDGTVVDIKTLVKLAKEYQAFLYLDEAHALGVFGEKGYGITEGYEQDIDLIMGTFSKSIGCTGGYVVCSNIIYQYLLNKCSGFVYSTALSPAIIGAIDKAWDLLEDIKNERYKLQEKATFLRKELISLGVDTANSNSQIIPVIISNLEVIQKIKEYLLSKGILVSLIKPPTVPYGKARLRISIKTSHTYLNLKNLIQELRIAWQMYYIH